MRQEGISGVICLTRGSAGWHFCLALHGGWRGGISGLVVGGKSSSQLFKPSDSAAANPDGQQVPLSDEAWLRWRSRVWPAEPRRCWRDGSRFHARCLRDQQSAQRSRPYCQVPPWRHWNWLWSLLHQPVSSLVVFGMGVFLCVVFVVAVIDT